MDYQEFKEALKSEVEAQLLHDYGDAKENMYCYAIDAGRNAERLMDVPHELHGGFALVARLGNPWAEDGVLKEMSVLVDNQLMNSWGVDRETLLKDAMENSMDKLPATLTPLGGVLEQMTGIPSPDMDVPLYVLTNQASFHGAGTLFYPGQMEKIAEEMGSFYVLPSSMHEILLLPDAARSSVFRNAGDLDTMVQEINNAEVAPNEILGDHSYHYDRESGMVTIDCREISRLWWWIRLLPRWSGGSLRWLTPA